MKQIIRSIIGCVSVAILVCTGQSCTKQMDSYISSDSTTDTGIRTCKISFNGRLIGFDHVETKATATTWSEGDKLYISFYSGSDVISGVAHYSSEGWTMNYDGDLAVGDGLKCEVRHFVNTIFANDYLVSLSHNSEIYEDLNGTYNYDGNTLSVQGYMTPKTGRIRFMGTPNETIHLRGVSINSSYAPSINQFYNSRNVITLTVDSTGYTPYIYGTIAESNRKLGIIGADFAFTRTCKEEVLKVGESGYMAIPSENSHNNWRNGLEVTVGDVVFKMIPVTGHESGFYLIGETEVTHAIYEAVCYKSSTTNATKPITYKSYEEYESFLTQLNYETSLTFSIPSAEQWKYAARGGNKSQGYTYAGSNNPGDVAWYEGNAEGSIHDVKQLAPNELGIYDMSGNVSELTSTRNNSSHYYVYGGNYITDENFIRTDTDYYDIVDYWENDRKIGFRLICTFE